MQGRNSHKEQAENKGTLWVFAYGSLIWNPCFAFIDRQVALLYV
ncbi:gamma-glutamylcyclotransferase [Magnetovibrio sp. PR-2]